MPGSMLPFKFRNQMGAESKIWRNIRDRRPNNACFDIPFHSFPFRIRSWFRKGTLFIHQETGLCLMKIYSRVDLTLGDQKNENEEEEGCSSWNTRYTIHSTTGVRRRSRPTHTETWSDSSHISGKDPSVEIYKAVAEEGSFLKEREEA